MKESIIQNVNSFSLFEKELILVKKQEGLFVNNQLITSLDEVGAYLFQKKYLFHNVPEDLFLRILNLDTKESNIVKNLSFWYETFDKGYFIATKRIRETKIQFIQKYNFGKREIEKILFEEKNFYVIFGNSTYLGIKINLGDYPQTFIFYNHQTETTLWQYSVAELGAEKVSKILGVFGQVLVVVCDYSKEIELSNGQKNTYPFAKIIGLHEDTGQLLYEVDGYELDGEYKLFGPSSCSLFVYNDGETILHALIGFYLTFDTQTGETKILNIHKQALSLGIEALKSASIDGHYLGFRAYNHKVGGFDSAVGIFNTKTLKIEDHYTNEEANKEGAFFGPGQPKIHGNKIYALDTKNTLHILERE